MSPSPASRCAWLAWLILLFMAGCASGPDKRDTPAGEPPRNGEAREKNGWLLVESHPAEVRYRVLLLPGFLCTDLVYADLLSDRRLSEAGVRLTAGNPPGFKGMPVKGGFDYGIESYAAEVESLAAVEPYDLIMGHSLSGNVLIEVAARNRYPGKLALLSPSLRRSSEGDDMRLMSHLVHIPLVGTFSMWASYQIMGSFYRPCMNEEHNDLVPALIAEGQKTPVGVATRQIDGFFDHIDHHGNLTERLISSRNQVWYVRGDRDEVILWDEDRSRLGKSANVTVKDIPGGKHFIMVDRPSELSALILEILSGAEFPDSGAGRL